MVAQSPGRKVCLRNNQVNGAFIHFLHQNNILNSYQTKLEEPPKHLFGVKQKYTSLFLLNCSKIKGRQTIRTKTFSRKFKMPFWPELRSDECHFLSLRLLMLCYAPCDELYCPFDQSGVAVCWSNQHC